MNYTITQKQRLFQGFFAIDQYSIDVETFAGQSMSIEREVFERGTAAAVLPYDPIRDEVVLIEQFRAGAINTQVNDDDNPWLFELIAGMHDKNESGRDLVIREAQEEANLKLNSLVYINKYLVSPGGTTETTELFLALVDTGQVTEGVFGLADEHEDIKVHVLTFDDAFAMTQPGGRATNAMTLIGLQWLALNKARFQ